MLRANEAGPQHVGALEGHGEQRVFDAPIAESGQIAVAIGMGMNGRGAVEIIVAGIGLQRGLISQEIFSILVFMAIFTTATVPFFLKWGTDWLRRRGELVRAQGRRTSLIILGAGPTARALAHALAPGQVRLVDTNPASCRKAEAEGLSVTCGDALQEQVLAEALKYLKAATATRRGKLATILRALFTGGGDFNAYLARMQLDSPRGLMPRLERRLLIYALGQTR